MKTGLFAAMIACGWQALPAVGAIVAVDDFSAPDPADVFLIMIDHPNAMPIQQGGLAGVVGGERDVLVTVQGVPSVQSAQLLIGIDAAGFGRGLLQLATARDPGTSLLLQYDGEDADDDTLINARGLMLDLTDDGTNDRMVIEFLSVDAPGAPGLDLTIRLTSSLGGSASSEHIVPESAVPISLTAPLAAFATTGNFSMAQIDSIEIEFNAIALKDADFAVGSIFAIPEPGSAALLWFAALAVVTLARRKR